MLRLYTTVIMFAFSSFSIRPTYIDFIKMISRIHEFLYHTFLYLKKKKLDKEIYTYIYY